jgi:hypothetical protein
MMREWFECKAKFEKDMNDGLTKTVTEVDLVDALSFTEAEKRFVEEMSAFIRGEFNITDIKRAKINELFEGEDLQADKWFKCRVAFISMDEKTEKEKRTMQTMMVKAIDLPDAVKLLQKYMTGTLGDYLITSITETKIMDVFPYQTAE